MLPVLKLVSHTDTAGSDWTYIRYTNELPVCDFGTGSESEFGRICHFDGSGLVYQGLPIRIRDRSGIVSGMKICIVIANWPDPYPGLPPGLYLSDMKM